MKWRREGEVELVELLEDWRAEKAAQKHMTRDNGRWQGDRAYYRVSLAGRKVVGVLQAETKELRE